MKRSGGGSDYPFGWIIRPDEGEPISLDGRVSSDREEPDARQDTRGSAPPRYRSRIQRTPSPISPISEARRSGDEDRKERRRAGAHARPAWGPGAVASRHPPTAGPGALTSRSGRELERGALREVLGFGFNVADTVSLVLFLAMVVFAITWFLRILG